MTILRELRAELASFPITPFTVAKINPGGETMFGMLYTVTRTRINHAENGIELYLLEDKNWHDWYPQDFEINRMYVPN